MKSASSHSWTEVWNPNASFDEVPNQAHQLKCVNVFMSEQSVVCPICHTPGEPVRNLPARFLRDQMADYFSTPLPASVNIADYRLQRCPECTLQFATPQTPGSSEFYDWLSQQPGYYPKGRWEWNIVLEELKIVSERPLRLLEVGCGDGTFLERMLTNFPKAEAFGLDASPKAVIDASGRGATAFVGDVRQFLAEHPEHRHGFDVAASFHCLEHVADPVGFMESMLELVHDRGRVYVSTPYSPMSLEVDWFDSLNHPPHHLTRWNQSSYEKLAKVCQTHLRLLMPGCPDAWTRALASNAATHGGKGALESLGHQRWHAALHPFNFWRHRHLQQQREFVNGRTAADVVLAEFRPCPV